MEATILFLLYKVDRVLERAFGNLVKVNGFCIKLVRKLHVKRLLPTIG